MQSNFAMYPVAAVWIGFGLLMAEARRKYAAVHERERISACHGYVEYESIARLERLRGVLSRDQRPVSEWLRSTTPLKIPDWPIIAKLENGERHNFYGDAIHEGSVSLFSQRGAGMLIRISYLRYINGDLEPLSPAGWAFIPPAQWNGLIVQFLDGTIGEFKIEEPGKVRYLQFRATTVKTFDMTILQRNARKVVRSGGDLRRKNRQAPMRASLKNVERKRRSAGMVQLVAKPTRASFAIPDLPGARYLKEFLTRDGEAQLLVFIDGDDSGQWLPFKRRRKDFGYVYEVRRKKIGAYLGPLPPILRQLSVALVEAGLMREPPDQAIVQEYFKDQSLGAHTDIPPYGPDIVSVSLGQRTTMVFTHPSGAKYSHILEPRSALALSGPAREEWKHAIPGRKTDPVTDVPFTRRLSITFRTIPRLRRGQGVN
jgi:alkylated DNA repair protein (DNA oxidative demethylase)